MIGLARGPRVDFPRDGFLEFIEAPEPRGLGTKKEAIRNFHGDSSNPLRVEFERLAEGKPGGGPGHPEVARDETGRFKVVHPDDDEAAVNPNAVRIDGDIPSPPRPPAPRDRSREPQAGTSIGYAVRRLEREAAKDPEGHSARVLARFEAGEISAIAAIWTDSFEAFGKY